MAETLETGSQVPLRDYFAVVTRRKWTIALAVMVIVGLSVASSARTTPVYEARATVLLQPRSSDNVFGLQTVAFGADRVRAVETEIEVLTSEAVAELVVTQTGLRGVPRVSGDPVGNTDVIAVKVQSPDPDLAARVANAYSAAYIQFRRTQAVDDLKEASKEVASGVAELDAELARTKDPNARQALIEQQAGLSQEVSRLNVRARLRSGGAQVVSPARVPISPFKPTPVRTAILALMLGLMLGVGLAFAREYLDDTLKDHDDLERSLAGSPTLGQIPSVATWRDKRKPLVVSLTEPTSSEAEAYRALRTSITFAGLERSVKTILFTSGKASEGKTTTVANLGVALARAGKLVAMVDADLRRPRINEFFGVSADVGLTSVLVGDHELSEALVHVSDDLWMLPSGPIPPNPSELLSGHRIAELIAALADPYDFVLIDSPPMLPVSDSVALSGRVDGVVLVATAGSSTRREMNRCLELLNQVNAPLLGAVFNRTGGGPGYGYGYGYGYATDSARKAPPKDVASAAPDNAPAFAAFVQEDATDSGATTSGATIDRP